MNTQLCRLLAVGVAASIASACSSLPETVPELTSARMKVNELNTEPLALQVAGDDLDEARTQLGIAEEVYEDDGDIEILEHHAYMAATHAEIGLQRIAEETAREELRSSEAVRSRILLEARTREAEAAERRADEAVEAAQRLAEELQARETARGIVLTLGDVLFDTDSASLKPGAQPVLDRLAEFMHANDGYRLLIEGHTDSRGSEDYNIALSDERADAVRAALRARSVPARRLETEGLGEAYPVATNQSAAGRQENRRVEIIVSDASGDFPANARRVASTS
ncbi:MAG TPA: OmpA family protein [Gammaproteobacteria bacterium]|nr:OmpA family protein [Gammaproteobacteria bacterium]